GCLYCIFRTPGTWLGRETSAFHDSSPQLTVPWLAGGGFELQSRIDSTQLIDSATSENGTIGTNGISLLHFSYSLLFLPVPISHSTPSVAYVSKVSIERKSGVAHQNLAHS